MIDGLLSSSQMPISVYSIRRVLTCPSPHVAGMEAPRITLRQYTISCSFVFFFAIFSLSLSLGCTELVRMTVGQCRERDIGDHEDKLVERRFFAHGISWL